MVELTLEINALKSSLFWTVINRGILNKLIKLQKAHNRSDYGYVPYCFFAMLFFHSQRVKFVP